MRNWIAVLALLIASLGVQFAVGPAPKIDKMRLLRDIDAAAQDRGFAMSRFVIGTVHIVVEGKRANCTIRVLPIAPGAYTASVGKLRLDLGNGAVFRYRGASYTEGPRVTAVVSNISQRLLGRFGVYTQTSPILLIASSDGCEEPDTLFDDARWRLRPA